LLKYYEFKNFYDDAVLLLNIENDMTKRREILENLKYNIESVIELGEKINRLLFIGTNLDTYSRELIDMCSKIRIALWDNSLSI